MPPLEINNNHFYLLPEKTVFWNEENVLLIADVHLGKDKIFRLNGLAVPEGTLDENL